MKFEKGKPKTGGRRKGTPNKVTESIRQKLLILIDGSFETVKDDLKSLPPQDRLNTFFRFLEYAIPKPKDVKIDISSLSETEIDDLIETILAKQND